MKWNKVVNNTTPPKKPHEHQYAIPVEWEPLAKRKGDFLDDSGEWLPVNGSQARKFTVTKLRCACGEEIER